MGAQRTIVIGDVHGCVRETQALVEKVRFDTANDRLVFVGDLVDKGPDGPGAVALARSLGALCVMGNHEEKALRWLRHETRRAADPKYKNPMKTTKPDQYEPWMRLSVDDIAWLTALPVSIDLGNGITAVHAGFLPGKPMAEQYDNDIMRIRWVDTTTLKSVSLDKSPDGFRPPEGAVPWMLLWDGPCGVVYGHVVHGLERPRIDVRPNGPCYGIDTGCVHGGHLTAAIFEGGSTTPEFVQVKAFAQYTKWVNID